MHHITIRPMTIDDYDAVIALLQKTEGVSIRDADSLEATQRYLARNPNLSFVATEKGAVIGCIMAGHDGRRGYLQHLAVATTHRNRGIASHLIENSLAELERLGIYKSHIDVLQSNASAQRYWKAKGWVLRADIRKYSTVRGGGGNA